MSEPRGSRLSMSPHLSRSYAASPSTKFLLTNSFRYSTVLTLPYMMISTVLTLPYMMRIYVGT